MYEGFLREIERFYQSCRRELFAYALSLTGDRDAAEDAVHDMFRKLIQRGRMPCQLKPFAYRCLRNAALDLVRERNLEIRHLPLFAQNYRQDEPADGMLQDILREQVEAAMSALPVDERECILLKIFSDMTFREIARVRRAPQGTVASWYRRGLERIRASVEGRI